MRTHSDAICVCTAVGQEPGTSHVEFFKLIDNMWHSLPCPACIAGPFIAQAAQVMRSEIEPEKVRPKPLRLSFAPAAAVDTDSHFVSCLGPTICTCAAWARHAARPARAANTAVPGCLSTELACCSTLNRVKCMWPRRSCAASALRTLIE